LLQSSKTILTITSAIVYIQNTVRLPVVAVLFHLPLIMGSGYVPWGDGDYYTFGGLALIIGGLIIYMKDSIKKGKKSNLDIVNEYTSFLPSSVYEDIKIFNSAPLPARIESGYETFGLDKRVDLRSIVIGNI
jgi:hypothetical protein